MSITININDLLSGKIVEGTRVEYKKGWNPDPIFRTICAFANDFENEGSGYIVIGVEENDGVPIRPVCGINIREVDKIQKEINTLCKLIQPSYYPRFSLEEIDEKHVMVIWVPAGSNRPYKVPDSVTSKIKKNNYRIRYGSSSIVPEGDQEIELIQLTAKIPYDDRVNTFASVKDLDFGLMREHLYDIGSRLYDDSAAMSVEELADHMNLSQGADEHLFPKNVGLLMFSKDPQTYHPFAKIEVVLFPEGLSGPFSEKVFSGPIQKQLESVLDFLQINVLKEVTQKVQGAAASVTMSNYPYNALEEAIANAVYHRNYEITEPTEIRVLPDRIEIISYNGVDPSIKQRDFERGNIRARRYRNRRIGEFLKELQLTEGRGTGLPTIIKDLADNGSPSPTYDTDDPARRHFIIELSIHPVFSVKSDGGPIGGPIDADHGGPITYISDNQTVTKIGSGGPIGGPIPQDELTERQSEILKIIHANDDISERRIAEILGINRSAVQKHTGSLRRKGVLERVEGTRGKWLVKYKFDNE